MSSCNSLVTLLLSFLLFAIVLTKLFELCVKQRELAYWTLDGLRITLHIIQ